MNAPKQGGGQLASASHRRLSPGDYARWVIPLEITVKLGTPIRAGTPSKPIPPPGDEGPYYDATADQQDQDAYYASIDATSSGQQMFQELSQLLSRTHHTVLSYRAARLEHLYPWVDLQPGGELRSLYSGIGFAADELIQADLSIEAQRDSRLQEFLYAEGAVSESAHRQFLEQLEAQLPFNCEHVVPQSWFDRRPPMVSDLHHLFTCEPKCNSFRGNVPYYQFPPEEAVRAECGRRENGKFEPESGKGAAARATLYFLLRYPGQVGDENRELQRQRLFILLQWHRDFPVSLWERHRNFAIARAQGNRNPLIDRPDWGSRIDFNPGFG